MRKIFITITLALLLKSQLVFCQETSILPTNPSDTLKAQLNSLQSIIENIKNDIEQVKSKASSAEKEAEKEEIKRDIREKQIKAIKLCAKFTERFAHGTKATDAILSAMETGIAISALQSPFLNVKFKGNYDTWADKWGKWLPVVLLPSASLLLKNENAKIASVPVGISLTALVGALSKSGKNKDKDLSNSFADITATMDLFDFNRTVYDDVQKIQATIKSVNSADSKLWMEFKDFWERNEDIAELPEALLLKRAKTYIDTATLLFERFQLKLVRINYVLDFASSMLNSYQQRYEYVASEPLISSNKVLIETKNAIDKVKKIYDDNRKDWNELQGTFYKMTPNQTRTLESFYQLEEYYQQINGNGG